MSRKKTRPVCLYVDRTYEPQIDYIKSTCGLTAFIEAHLKNVRIPVSWKSDAAKILNIPTDKE